MNANRLTASLKLRARVCRTGAEIVTLLEAGHADGAFARWRSLYELMVVLALSMDRGNAVADAFLDHDVVASHRTASAVEAIKRARGGTRTRTTFRSTDFKSGASTIPPPGQSGKGKLAKNFGGDQSGDAPVTIYSRRGRDWVYDDS